MQSRRTHVLHRWATMRGVEREHGCTKNMRLCLCTRTCVGTYSEALDRPRNKYGNDKHFLKLGLDVAGPLWIRTLTQSYRSTHSTRRSRMNNIILQHSQVRSFTSKFFAQIDSYKFSGFHKVSSIAFFVLAAYWVSRGWSQPARMVGDAASRYFSRQSLCKISSQHRYGRRGDDHLST